LIENLRRARILYHSWFDQGRLKKQLEIANKLGAKYLCFWGKKKFWTAQLYPRYGGRVPEIVDFVKIVRK